MAQKLCRITVEKITTAEFFEFRVIFVRSRHDLLCLIGEKIMFAVLRSKTPSSRMAASRNNAI